MSVQPEGTGFPAIPGSGAGASLVAVGPWGAPGHGGRLTRDVVWKPISVFMVEFPGLCLECSVVTAAWRTPHLFSENTWIKEANLKLTIYLCYRKRSEEKPTVAVTGKTKRESEVESAEDAVLGKKPKLEDVVSEDAK